MYDFKRGSSEAGGDLEQRLEQGDMGGDTWPLTALTQAASADTTM